MKYMQKILHLSFLVMFFSSLVIENFNLVFREYRHRRRHRKDLKKLIDESNENDEAEKADNGQEKTVESVLHQPIQQSNSFRRRRNESGEENPFTKRKMEQTDQVTSEKASASLPIVEHSYISTEMAPIQSTIKLNPAKDDQLTNDIVDVQSTQPNLSHGEEHCISLNDKDSDEEENDPLGFIAIKSAAQWMAVSKRISWNFEGKEQDKMAKDDNLIELDTSKPVTTSQPIDTPLKEPPKIMHDYENVLYDIYCPEYNGNVADFKPTKVQQLRLICWKIKPWKQPKSSFGGQRLFTSAFAAPWGADCDEVYPGLFIGDKASASNVAFLKRYGITHVLNAAEGNEEGLVDLNQEHYHGSDISYLGFPLWDAPGCNLTPYFGIGITFFY